MKKALCIIIILMIGLTSVSAQELPGYENLPPLPTIISPANEKLPNKLSQEVLQQLFVLHDQQKYIAYLLHEGKITQEEHDTAIGNKWTAIVELCTPILEGYRYMLVLGDIKEEIRKLWGTWLPGWPSAQTMRERVGFALQEPPRARVNSHTTNGLIRIEITPLSDEIYSNMKRQFEAALGVTLEAEEGFPDYSYEYTHTVPADKSATGKPFQINLTRYTKPQRIYIEIIGG